jgi:hypothetical protein
MTSWIYLFSRFTPEVLLFEVLFICVLTSFYSTFWFMRRRRLGVITESMPAGVLKHYLAEVMQNAKNIQGELFGEAVSSGAPSWSSSASQLTNKPDPNLLQKFSDLENKLTEKEAILQRLTQEKLKAEKELETVKLTSEKKGPSLATANNGELLELKEKIQTLEDRLLEYSIIEDDLANLKRLQQENSVLKKLMTTHGVQVPGGEVIAAVPSAVASPSASPSVSPTPVPAPTQIIPQKNQSFEGLVDHVEKSLEGAPPPSNEKSDGELVAEFEKMLKS